MESLDFAVGLRPVGPSSLVHDGAEGVAEHPGSVAGAVVSQDPLNGDPDRGEVRVRAGLEPGCGLLLLVGGDLRECQP